MRLLLLATTVLALSATSAFAEWRRTGQLQDRENYADPSSIVRTGSMSKIWVMTDYHELQTWEGYSFISTKAQIEYDCAQPRSRVLVEDGYTGRNATGKTTYHVQGPRPWQAITQGTIGEIRRNLACRL